MDTFMDKLAQKLTAQEMIKANSAADAEEMKKLKNQVKEYEEILEQMQQLIADGAMKLENAKVDGNEINRLVEKSIAQISQIQYDAQEIDQIQEDLGQLEQTIRTNLYNVSESLNHLEQVIDEKQENAGENLKQLEQSLGTKMDTSNESIHKECVKVYRNVQAAVVEESTKQTESITAAVKGLKGKLSAVLGVSIVALIAAVGGFVFQILVYLKVI